MFPLLFYILVSEKFLNFHFQSRFVLRRNTKATFVPSKAKISPTIRMLLITQAGRMRKERERKEERKSLREGENERKNDGSKLNKKSPPKKAYLPKAGYK
jgi:hypothetical protein